MDSFKDLTGGQAVVFVILLIILIPLFILLNGWIVATLWNCIMPVLFGLMTLSVKQGVIVFLLCRWLFSSESLLSKDD